MNKKFVGKLRNILLLYLEERENEEKFCYFFETKYKRGTIEREMHYLTVREGVKTLKEIIVH